MKNKNHNKIIKDYDKQKSKTLKKLASKLLDIQDKFHILRGKKINDNFLKNF